jgi:hypothetical protein
MNVKNIGSYTEAAPPRIPSDSRHGRHVAFMGLPVHPPWLLDGYA